jgi:outer membrane protein assembly factor BamB
MRLCVAVTTVLLTGPFVASTLADPWPGFRGPTGQGHSREIRLPISWSATDGVLWKTPIEGSGWSSPIVWGGRVFVTTARDEGRACHVLALDRRSGTVLWDTKVFTQTLKRKENKNSYATPTPATDGSRVFAACGDGSLVAVDAASGAVHWTNRDYPFYSQHGLATSLLLYRDLVIQARDGSSEGPDKSLGWQTPWDQSFIVALDARTGTPRWQARRGMSRIAHVTPIVAKISGADVLLSPAGDVIQGFEPTSGKRLWTVPSPGEGVVPSPVMAAGHLVTASGFGAPAVRAVRTVGTLSVAWEQTQGVPMQASPIAIEDQAYVVTDGGVLSALHASTGVQVWQERLGGTFSSSPVAADGKLYLLNEACETVVVAPGASFAQLARNPLEGRCQASMAVSGGLLFIRNDTAVYAIGTQPR